MKSKLLITITLQFFVILKLISFTYQNELNVILPYEVLNGRINVLFKVGTPPKDINVVIDIKQCGTVLTESQYDNTKSSTNIHKGFGYAILPTHFSHSNLYWDIISIQPNFINQLMLFFLIDWEEVCDYCFIGLSRVEEIDQTSFIHQLKDQKMINKLIFTLKPNDNKNGLVIFGDVSDNITSNKNKFKCKFQRSKTHKRHWNCQLHKINIDNMIIYHYNQTDHLFFSTVNDKVLIPLDFYLVLKEEFIVKTNNKCKAIENKKEDIYYIVCDDNYLKGKEISFYFGDYLIKMEMSLFFNENHLFVYSNKLSEQAWIFGVNFLNFFTTTFNIENNEMAFYLRTDLDNNIKIQKVMNIEYEDDYDLTDLQKVIRLYIINICMITFSILMLVYLIVINKHDNI